MFSSRSADSIFLGGLLEGELGHGLSVGVAGFAGLLEQLAGIAALGAGVARALPDLIQTLALGDGRDGHGALLGLVTSSSARTTPFDVAR